MGWPAKVDAEFGCCNNLGAIFFSLVFFIFPLHLYRAKARDEKCFIRNYVNFSLHVHRQAAQRKFEKFPQSVSSTALTPKWKEHSKRAQMKMLAHNSPIFHVVFFLRGRSMYNIFSNRKIMLLDYWSFFFSPSPLFIFSRKTPAQHGNISLQGRASFATTIIVLDLSPQSARRKIHVYWSIGLVLQAW